MKVIETFPGNRDFHLFGEVLSHVNATNETNISDKDAFNMEFLDRCFVFLEKELPVARAAVYHNPTLKYQDIPAHCIGNYACINDEVIAKKCLSHVLTYIKGKGAQFVIGPMNGSTWDNYRFRLDDEAPPFFLEPQHPNYYNQQFKAAGFEVIANYFSSLDTTLPTNMDFVLQREEALRKLGVYYRNLNLESFEDELALLYDFNTLAFKTNFLYTPISKEVFIAKHKAAAEIIDPFFFLMAFNAHNQLVGYFFCLHNFLDRTNQSLIMKTLARHPDGMYQGLGHVLGNKLTLRAKQAGYTQLIHAFMYNDGTSTEVSKNYAGKKFKNYVLYGKEI